MGSIAPGIQLLLSYRTRAIITRSWILTIHKDRIFQKKLLENKEMVLKKWVKSIQTAGYNGACTIYTCFLSYSALGASENCTNRLFCWTQSYSVEINTRIEVQFYLKFSTKLIILWLYYTWTGVIMLRLKKYLAITRKMLFQKESNPISELLANSLPFNRPTKQECSTVFSVL